MLLLRVHIEAMRYRVEVVVAYTANEAVALQVLLHRLQLVSQLTKGVNDQTWKSRIFFKTRVFTDFVSRWFEGDFNIAMAITNYYKNGNIHK